MFQVITHRFDVFNADTMADALKIAYASCGPVTIRNRDVTIVKVNAH